MKTLDSIVSFVASASAQGWAFLYDIYLPSAISTPWGTISTLRLTNSPTGIKFFTPLLAPEPSGTRGAAQTYQHWPITFSLVKSDAKFSSDRVDIQTSNVTAEWAGMLDSIDWESVPVMIRAVPTNVSSPPLIASNCAVIFIGYVETATLTEMALQLSCGNDAATLENTLPNQSFHSTCRFAWGDDDCGAIRYLPTNYKSKTVGSGSTTTIVVSSDFTEDTTQNARILGVESTLAGLEFRSPSHGLVPANLDRVRFLGSTLPPSVVSGVWYYVALSGANPTDNFKLYVPGGSAFGPASLATGFPWSVETTLSYGVDLIDAQANGNFAGSGSQVGFEEYQIKTSAANYWKASGSADWGTVTQAVWEIPVAQAGLANPALKPYVTIFMGAAKRPRIWRVQLPPGINRDQMARLILLFSSNDGATWKHETYYEIPPRLGSFFDILVPNAANVPWWRICVRSKWGGEQYSDPMLGKVQAFENSRNFWATGQLTFTAATTTVALRGISVPVVASFAGQVQVTQLPVAPVAGDTFTIERRCGRTFNDCSERGNWRRFGGFDSLPPQTAPRPV